MCVQRSLAGTLSVMLAFAVLKRDTHGGCVVQKLWHSTVRGLPPDTPASEVEVALSFFAIMCERCVIHLPTLCELVNDSASLRPPHTLTLRSLDRFHEVLLRCNSFQSTIGLITGTGGGVAPGDDYAVAPGPVSYTHLTLPTILLV